MPGVATTMLLVPSEHLAIVVLCNAWSSSTVDAIVDQIAATRLPGWQPAKEAGFPTPTPNFKPSPELAGRWTGYVLREEGKMPVELTISPAGAITGKFGNQAPVALDRLSFSNARLSGAFKTSLDTRDSDRYPYVVYLDLKWAGARLYGAAIALGDFSTPKFVAALSHWMDLHRQA